MTLATGGMAVGAIRIRVETHCLRLADHGGGHDFDAAVGETALIRTTGYEHLMIESGQSGGVSGGVVQALEMCSNPV